MKIGIIGSGMVGRAFALRLAELGHDVVVGTRNVRATFNRTEPDAKGIPAWQYWAKDHPEIKLVTFTEAGKFADVIINATEGANSLRALTEAGEENLRGKIILDLALPLSYSDDRPPHLSFANDDSLGEQIQRTFTSSRVVKTLNTMSYSIMLDPSVLPGAHNAFMSGDSNHAKAVIVGLLAEFGWPEGSVIDLGNITTSRATEMYATLLFQLSAIRGNYDFNIAVVEK
ncbi:TPA: NAD(P)-binding domain-containing protein [Klebsiella quasipneumoniae subsp. similipneumoniae]|nr:NAD(P)-binding domain-containing protein [Klebsiella quasipneumoniae subsp. similipneumoniae]